MSLSRFHSARATIKQTPQNKYQYFWHGSIFFSQNFLALFPTQFAVRYHGKSYQLKLSLFRSGTDLNIKDDFFKLRREIN